MDETSQLGLPLVQPAQAQKHVTVNEAMARLDGLTQMRLQSVTQSVPPLSADDGVTYAVPVGGVNAWAGQDGKVAIASNGGWVFVPPAVGWRAWVVDAASEALFDGVAWVGAALAVSPNRAASRFHVLEFDHTVVSGAISTSITKIPAFAMVFAVTGRVKTAITGASSFNLGVAASSTRYGSGIGVAVGSFALGITGQPVTYFADTSVRLTAVGGNFTSGVFRIAIHYYTPTPPVI